MDNHFSILTIKILPEIPENTNDPSIIEIYNDIKVILGTSNVNLIFRQIATVPRGLDYIWSTLRPLYINNSIVNMSGSLIPNLNPNLTGSRPILTKANYLSAHNILDIIQVLETYKFSNPVNLIGCNIMLLCLQNPSEYKQLHKPNSYTTDLLTPKLRFQPLLPMHDLNQVSEETIGRLKALADIVPGITNANIPSLYRHFTMWPEFLDDIKTFLQPIFTEQKNIEHITEMHATAQKYAADILTSHIIGRYTPPNQTDSEALQTIIKRFPINMCALTIIANYLIEGLKETVRP